MLDDGWDRFTATGNIMDYLEYKGVSMASKNKEQKNANYDNGSSTSGKTIG